MPHLLNLYKNCNIILSVFGKLPTLYYTGSFYLTGLKMTTALEYQCHVFVDISPRDPQRLLVLNMSISDCLPSNDASEHSALDRPVATLDDIRDSKTMAEFSLRICKGEKPRWQAIETIPVASVGCPSDFAVTFWHRSGAKWGEPFKLAVWEVKICGTPMVSGQISSRSN